MFQDFSTIGNKIKFFFIQNLNYLRKKKSRKSLTPLETTKLQS